MKTIEQDYSIAAPVEEVWRALTEASVMEQWEAGPAASDPHEGGEFSLWGGDIHGIYTVVKPLKLLEQDWYGHDNPDWKYNVRFIFNDKDGNTTVHLVYSGDIQDQKIDIEDWRNYYFDPIKKLLEKQK